MQVCSTRVFRTAAFLAFLAIGLGAFGAHGLENVFAAQPKAREWWEKAAYYHMVHALAMLLLACLRPLPVASIRLFGTGIVLFSGSLYGVAVGAPRWLVHVTPVGGLCLLAGWFWLVVRPPVGTAAREAVEP